MEKEDIIEYILYRNSSKSLMDRDMWFIKKYLKLIHNVDVDYYRIVSDVRKASLHGKINTYIDNMLKHMMNHFGVNSLLDSKKQLIKYY